MAHSREDDDEDIEIVRGSTPLHRRKSKSPTPNPGTWVAALTMTSEAMKTETVGPMESAKLPEHCKHS
jgi:hypothetical protein